MEIKLTKNQRNGLIRSARSAYAKEREYTDYVDIGAVADAVADEMFTNEIELGLSEYEAIEISDYAYGVAAFVMPKEVF